MEEKMSETDRGSRVPPHLEESFSVGRLRRGGMTMKKGDP